MLKSCYKKLDFCDISSLNAGNITVMLTSKTCELLIALVSFPLAALCASHCLASGLQCVVPC